MAGRFGKRDHKDQIPGPGQYNQNMQTMAEVNDMRMKKAKAIQEQVKRSSSMFLQKQKMMSVGPQPAEAEEAAQGKTQGMSYLQRNDLEMRKASKNYLDQIQYDNRTNTIGFSAYQHAKRSNPLLTKLK